MQERDVVKIKTKFVRGIVSELIENALRNNTGYDASIQIGKLEIVNADEKVYIQLNGNAEMLNIVLNSLKIKCIRTIFIIGINLISNKKIGEMASQWLKSKYGAKFDFQINEINLSKNGGKTYFYLDIDVETEPQELRKILINAI